MDVITERGPLLWTASHPTAGNDEVVELSRGSASDLATATPAGLDASKGERSIGRLAPCGRPGRCRRRDVQDGAETVARRGPLPALTIGAVIWSSTTRRATGRSTASQAPGRDDRARRERRASPTAATSAGLAGSRRTSSSSTRTPRSRRRRVEGSSELDRTRLGVGAVAPRIEEPDGSLDYSLRRFPRLRSSFAQALFLHRRLSQGDLGGRGDPRSGRVRARRTLPSGSRAPASPCAGACSRRSAGSTRVSSTTARTSTSARGSGGRL